MAKFNEKLQELQLTENDASKAIKTKIGQYNNILKSYLEEKENGNDNQKLKKSLDDLDDKITSSIEKWYANRDAQSERMKKMREAREAKKANEPAASKIKPAAIKEEEEQDNDNDDDDDDDDDFEERRAEQERKLAEYRLRRAAEMQQREYMQQQQPEPKKKSKAIWVLAGLVAVVTLGAVILKDK
jgi:hypothetical protein